MKREHVKLLIETAPTVEKADELITGIYNFGTVAEKVAFLKGMFDVRIVSKHDGPGVTKEQSTEMDYWCMLERIVVLAN